ncbi:MAG: DUF1614 domain-containing protein [Candidatus Asgardarchaeia archaeon]
MSLSELIKKLIYIPISIIFLIIYLIIALFPFILLFSFYGIAFHVGLGLSLPVTALIIFLSLFGSAVNIPIAVLEQNTPIIRERYVRYMGIIIKIPEIDFRGSKVVLAVNLGGCIIPVILSLYLLYELVVNLGFLSIILIFFGVMINSIIIHQFARPIQGVGIATPWFIPPLVTAVITLIFVQMLPGLNVFAFAYIVGTLGTLIGADIMNLKAIVNLGTPAASIGGAGTFDGVFLTGIMSIFLLLLF